MTVTGAPLYGCLGRQIVTGSRLSGGGEPSCIAVGGPCGDLRRSHALPRHRLPGRQLDRGRAHPRLPPPAPRLQLPRTHASQAGVRSSPVADRAGPTPRGPSRPQAATWSAEDDAQRRTDAIPSRILPRHRRSPPPPGAAPRAPYGAGASERRDPVRHARLQGDQRMGRRPRPQGAGTLPRAPPRRPIPRAEPVGDAQPAHPRRPGATRCRGAGLARGP